MPRRFEHSATYDCTPATLHAALTDPAYWDARVAAVGGTGAKLDALAATEGGVEVTLTQVVPAENLPSIVGRIKPGDLVIVRTEIWGALDGSSARCEVTAVVSGTPATVSGTSDLTGDDTSATVRTAGEAKVSIPLVGGKIEQAVADNVVRLLVAEHRFTERWLVGK